MDNNWKVVFYLTSVGNNPVLEFIRAQDQRTKNKIEQAIELVKERNVKARYPLVSKVSGKIWEIRIEVATNIYRILYFIYVDKRIVLLHGFQKKSDKIPAKEIDIALARMKEYIE